MSEPKFTGIYTGANYKPFYFMAQEFGSEKTYRRLGARLLRYINSQATFTADQLRHKFGLTSINSWYYGGNRQYSGLRLEGEPYYRDSSDHSYGNALDMVFKDISAARVRKYIETHPDEFPFITFVEEGANVDWLHISVSHMSDTFRLDNSNAIVFWSMDTGEHRIIKRSANFNIMSFYSGGG